MTINSNGLLVELVKAAVLNLEISQTEVDLISWDITSAHILNICLEADMITEDDLLTWIDTCLKATGRRCYQQHLNGRYPDHVFSPAALAYAIGQDELTQSERQKIRYDHNETETEFIEIYGQPDFCRKIMKQICSLNPDDYKIVVMIDGVTVVL